MIHDSYAGLKTQRLFREYSVNVPEGEKVISVGQSQSITVFLTEPMEENYKPTEKTLYKINAFGSVSKWAIFRETK
ncbi:MAG: hypothetical protein [Wendovervirus sonii]|uniref:Uncharacterized protein n=1 Tax=phage Lak_Megaphage_Sonny TaxID=3109229 RepID=A0ABZ0Z2G7_9CAUD|nr:MAG: hypothetical protein [phage Lak_Megaphage_Sonny]